MLWDAHDRFPTLFRFTTAISMDNFSHNWKVTKGEHRQRIWLFDINLISLAPIKNAWLVLFIDIPLHDCQQENQIVLSLPFKVVHHIIATFTVANRCQSTESALSLTPWKSTEPRYIPNPKDCLPEIVHIWACQHHFYMPLSTSVVIQNNCFYSHDAKMASIAQGRTIPYCWTQKQTKVHEYDHHSALCIPTLRKGT